jgi:hypothetical protein
MTITLLHGCCQIETSAYDLDAVRDLLVGVLGGGPIEQALARQIRDLIPGDDYDVDHIDCGEAVFQVNRPSPAMRYNGRKSVHQAYLDRRGPSVTNLNFFVDDVGHARELLTSLGAQTHIEGPSSAARALADYGPGNTRPGADDRPFLFMGTQHLIGFDLEIMEPNFLHFSRQTTQYPAFVHPRPQVGDRNLILQRLIVAVPDLDATRENLARIFAPASRSKTYDHREGPLGRSFRVGLGGIEIEYCQPTTPTSELAQFLDRSGAGVAAISFAAKEAETVAAKCEAEALALIDRDTDYLGCNLAAPFLALSSRSRLGFDAWLARATH